MNTYEIAELTAVLSRRGLDGQCRIRIAGLRTPRIFIHKGQAHLATITDERDGSYRAYNNLYHAYSGNTFYGYSGNSKVAALANLLDSTA